MKKLITLLLGLASVFAFSACDMTALLGGTESSESVQVESVETKPDGQIPGEFATLVNFRRKEDEE